MPKKSLPLAVDLDGTLIQTDVLHESLITFLQQYPWKIFHLLRWWMKGRAYLKQQLALHITIDPKLLPYNQEVLAYLKEEKKKGREIILATAADQRLAKAVCDHLKLFDDYIASQGAKNLRSHAKAERLNERYGIGRYAYAGNSRHDLAVWKDAGEIIAVHTPASVLAQIQGSTKLTHLFKKPSFLPALIEALRPWQWVKNILIFLPLIAGHKMLDASLLASTLAAFGLFCMSASAIYILNDLLDLPSDRQHPTKRLRPFARGDLSIPLGLSIALILILVSLIGALYISRMLYIELIFYITLTTLYSSYFKRIVLLDVLVLAALYITRIMVGYTVSGLPLSHWLLGFSLFLFLSLAFIKRYTELRDAYSTAEKKILCIPGRGYRTDDFEQIASFGTVSGYIATLVLALYINSQDVLRLYAHPLWLWLLCPLCIYGISYLWLAARRGEMEQDPVLYATRQAPLYIMLGLGALITLLAL